MQKRNAIMATLSLFVLGACTKTTVVEMQPVRIPTTSLSFVSSRVSPIASSPSPASSAQTSGIGLISDSMPLLPVPFSSQAPFANWDALHEESCEEMAIIMVVHYLNKTSLTPDIAEKEIQDLVAWEHEHSMSDDITASQMVEVARQKFGFRARVRTDVTEDSIKEELALGNPVVIPAAGRLLGNPYFTGDGPWYHALVITGFKKGWTGDWFVTNDPGTKRGASYEYRVETLINAIHDWMGIKEEIAQGKKAMVILEK